MDRDLADFRRAAFHPLSGMIRPAAPPVSVGEIELVQETFADTEFGVYR
jgi:hypothetical protein